MDVHSFFTRLIAFVAMFTVTASAQAGLIPLVDSATARQGAAELTLDTLHLSARGEAGMVELKEAIATFREGKIDEALTRLKAAWEANKRLPPPPVMLARMFFATGAIVPGRQLLEQAAVAHPDAADVYLALGELALAEGRLTDAALQYEKAKALTVAPPDGDGQASNAATSGLAAVAERREQWAEAERLLVVCAKTAPANALFKHRLARVQFEQQRYEDAAKSLAEAEQLDEQMESAALVIGRWHHAAGHTADAARWMQTALEQSPNDPRTQVAAILWNLEVDQPEEARQHVERLAEVQPDAPEVLRLKGIVATFLRDFETAERCFQSLVTENPGDFAASNQLVLALIEQESTSKQRRAAQIAELNKRQYPTSPEAHATLGWVLYRLGQLETAERIFQPLLSGTQLSPDAAYYAARLLIDRGRTEEARAFLQGALDTAGNFRNRKPCQEMLASLPGPSNDTPAQK